MDRHRALQTGRQVIGDPEVRRHSRNAARSSYLAVRQARRAAAGQTAGRQWKKIWIPAILVFSVVIGVTASRKLSQ
jgi:hypothetical protein